MSQDRSNMQRSNDQTKSTHDSKLVQYKTISTTATQPAVNATHQETNHCPPHDSTEGNLQDPPAPKTPYNELAAMLGVTPIPSQQFMLRERRYGENVQTPGKRPVPPLDLLPSFRDAATRDPFFAAFVAGWDKTERGGI